MKYSAPLLQLLEAISNYTISGPNSISVSGITHDSRSVHPGSLFVCLRGALFDGHAFAEEAIERGATAIAACEGGLEKRNIRLSPNFTVITLPDTRSALPLLACSFYGNPSHRMKMIGITGTNGKTTTLRMISAILRASGMRVGTIGTLGAEIDGVALPSEHTTPESDQLQGLLAMMADEGADAVVMEVSSHALSQHRTDGIAFHVGVYTNISQDHLDFHGDMTSYFQSKARLFAEYPVEFPRPEGSVFSAVINVGHWEGRDMVTYARGDVITYATGDSPAVLRAVDIKLSPDSAHFKVIHDSGTLKYDFDVDIPVGGAFQVENALAAIGACLKLNISTDTIVEGMRNLPPIPGRFEAVPRNGLGFSVIVDYAHTPAAIENLIRSARELNPARIIVVFGCGGDRDRTKRPIMGLLAATLADIAIVTSDNPRSEDPQSIIDEILTGMDSEQNPEIQAGIHIQPDRREAIRLAISMTGPNDLLLIAGKGHENYQIVGDKVLYFDDREVVREILDGGY